jgi:hypothetical protein
VLPFVQLVPVAVWMLNGLPLIEMFEIVSV